MERSSPGQAKISGLRKEQLVTLKDLELFKEDLLISLARLIRSKALATPKKWLKGHEVQAILGISRGTLFKLRRRQVLPFTKVGKIHYYNQDEVNAVLAGKGLTGQHV